MKNKPFFPMFIDLSDKNIVVVGGGKIATRRVKTLLSFTRNIRVIAPKVTREMMELAKTGYVELLTRPVKRTDFAMAYMVIEFVVGITASGLDHKKAKKIREEIQKVLERIAQEDEE